MANARPAPIQGPRLRPASSNRPNARGPSAEPTSMPEYTSPYTDPTVPLGVTRRISMSREGAATPEQNPARPTTGAARAAGTQPAASTTRVSPARMSETVTVRSVRDESDTRNPPAAIPTADASM